MIDKRLQNFIDENPRKKVSIIIMPSPSKASVKKGKVVKIKTDEKAFTQMVKDLSVFFDEKEMLVLKLVKAVIVDKVSKKTVLAISHLPTVHLITFNKAIHAL